MSEISTICWICTSLLFLNITTGHPIDKVSADNKLEQKNEIHYPNGTVVGKYSYTDNDGNPINVKYYADKSSYGVELNSFKIIDPASNYSVQFKPNATEDLMKPMLDLASEIMEFGKEPSHKSAHKKPDKDKISKANHQTAHAKTPKISSPDYETFYQNEVKAPKQCEKDKVKVYLVKEKRRSRSVFLDGNEYASNYCEQF